VAEVIHAGMSRTSAAIAWIENGAAEGENRRTAYRAARLFGISQPAISQELSRRRAKRSVAESAAETAPATEHAERPGITFREIPYSDTPAL
jgi:hypothetical protein